MKKTFAVFAGIVALLFVGLQPQPVAATPPPMTQVIATPDSPTVTGEKRDKLVQFQLLASKFPEKFSGAFVDKNGNVRLAVAEGQSDDRANAEQGRSLADIDADLAELLPRDEVVGTFHDYRNNHGVIQLKHAPTEQFLVDLYAEYGDDIVVEEGFRDQDVMGFGGNRNADYSKFYMGAKVSAYLGHHAGAVKGGTCSIGIPIWLTGWDPRIITAGHCFPRNLMDQDKFMDVRTNYGGTGAYHVGTAVKTTWDDVYGGTLGTNGDLAAIDPGLDGVGPTNKTHGPSFFAGPINTGSTTVTDTIVGYDTWAANGDMICYSGATKGLNCDQDGEKYEVVDHDWNGNMNYTSSVDGQEHEATVTHEAYARKGDGHCPAPGDSGGMVFKYGTVNGITGARVSGINSGGGGGGDDYHISGPEGQFPGIDCRLYYTEVGQIFDVWPNAAIATFFLQP